MKKHKKLNLPMPGDSTQRLLFSNINSKNSDEFYLLMTFHKSMKGGFEYPVTAEQCTKALAKKGLKYKELEY
jgi:hypothetical protein